MNDDRSITIETEGRETVARDEATDIEARGSDVPTALYTLSEKLEMELLR